MAHVTVTIAGRAYRMACDDGQEQHLTGLAGEVDSRIEQLRTSFGEIGDQRLSVMAAITISDELAEARARIRKLEEDLAGQSEVRAAALERLRHTEDAMAEAVEVAAERLERLARELGTSPSGTVGMG
ncbi:MAG TPA: cell division protein ZapA [Xanthobacteraceae bacterium]|nr:cell division protein ZapA [Xanthobacteraceae bacterium]